MPSYTPSPPVTSTSLNVVGLTTGNMAVLSGDPVRLDFTDTASNAGARNWMFRLDSVVFGDFQLAQSNAKDGDPFAAGTTRFYIKNDGSVGFGISTPAEKVEVNGSLKTYGRLITAKGVGVATASQVTLGADGNFFTLTGTTTVDGIVATGWAGSMIVLTFDSAVTIVNNSGSAPANGSFLLSGAVNFAATANDMLCLIQSGSAWNEVSRTIK